MLPCYVVTASSLVCARAREKNKRDVGNIVTFFDKALFL